MGSGDVAPDHHLGELGLAHISDRRAARDATVSQHHDPIADFEHLREFVADENDAFALRAQPAQDRQEIGDFRRRQV